LRVQFRNGWYHVTARGSNRQNIYRDERDRLHFLELLGEMSERHTVEVHSYALMDNHYHLLLRTPLANLSRAVQWLNTAYGIWWNLRHRRVGHVFQGRFKSVVVESGQWVLECSLYIHLNPVAISVLELSKAKKKAERRGLTVAPVAVRAKRLEVLRSCPWSSFRALAGYSRGPQKGATGAWPRSGPGGAWSNRSGLGSSGAWCWAARALRGRCGPNWKRAGRAREGGPCGLGAVGPRWCGGWSGRGASAGPNLRAVTAIRAWRWRCMWRGVAPV
jgi:REP element-mobilizing transposase RayT